MQNTQALMSLLERAADAKDFALIENPARNPAPFPDNSDSLNRDNMAAAMQCITQWESYRPTPLVELPDLAQHCGLGRVLYKDESSRFNLGSFKSLGGAYALAELVRKARERGEAIEQITVATATDGNHGRSLAWGARQLGCTAKIYIHAYVSEQRAEAMRQLGADVTRVDGNYEASLAACKRDANANGWQIISDTSWQGYRQIPLDIMAGYTVMAQEILAQLEATRPTHVFLPVGVGGLAAAVIAALWQDMNADLCQLISVESDKSCCCFRSIAAGTPTDYNIVEETLMAGLSCGEMSEVAWEILLPTLSHCACINDDAIAPLMRWFNQRTPSVEAGECSVAGLAALLQAQQNPSTWQALGLGPDSTVLLLGTEGASDPVLYRQLVEAAA